MYAAHKWTFRVLAIAALLAAGLSTGALAEGPYNSIWLEAEEPAEANFEFNTGAGRPHLLSGEKWLQRSVEKKELEGIPEEGFRLEYEMTVPEAGTYEAWARVGMEWIRAPFQWRIDEGAWRPGPADRTTTNVMELSDWNPVAWLHLGKVELPAGDATLAVRYTEANQDKMHIALDCFAFTAGRFVPEGKLRPGQTYEAETDRKAADQVFQFPQPAGDAARDRLELSGTWQVARYDDPDMDVDTYVPVRRLPKPEEYPLRWMGIEVPGSLWGKDQTRMAHRVIYRTRVEIPDGHRGRGFKLHFSGTNWIVSVFVNGRLAGSHRGVWIPWDLDVSNLVEPGEVNEIAVAVKGPYYAVDVENYHGADDLDEMRHRPKGRQSWVYYVAPIYPSTKGDGNGLDYGIVNPVTLSAVGDAYTEDVFVQPGLDRHHNKRLKAEVTVRNTGPEERTLQVRCDAVNDAGGEVEKKFKPAEVTVPAGETETVTIAERWKAPKLWWPKPDPHLYRLRTTILEEGEPVDVQEELFGFRWITVKDTGIYINGVRRNLWNWVGVHGNPRSGEEWLQQFREENNRFTRFSHNRKTRNFLPSREERLEFYDRNGIPGRLCSMIDGMFINRWLGKKMRSPVTGEHTMIPNRRVWEGFKRHIRQLARAYRNHPSVIMYQVENELVYINGMNLGFPLDDLEDLMGEVIEAGRAEDPTRPYTVGGAGDLGCECEIHSPHYPRGRMDWYPENAYTVDKYSSKISNWPWERNKPWLVGESCFSNRLGFGSYVIGDRAFRGAWEARRGKAAFLRMLYCGYRWAGVAGFCPWDNLYEFEDSTKTFSDLCAIPRRQSHRLFAGRENRLLFKIMNDTLSSEPVTFTWSYEAGGEEVAGGSEKLRIEPGFGKEQTLRVKAPETATRLNGTLTLKVTQPGAADYVDRREVPVLPAVETLETGLPVAVLDRSDRLADFLKAKGVEFDRLQEMKQPAEREGLLLVGPDTLTAEEAFGRDLLKYAVAGGRVIVLEQDLPAGGNNLPAPLRSTTHFGGYAHPQALGTPVFRDLGAGDLIDWAAGHPTYKHVYEKPTRGGRSLAECGSMLPYSALVEMPAGRGVIVLCQLRVGANLEKDAAADVLLRNLVEHYAAYRPPSGVAGVYAPEAPLLREKVRAGGAMHETVDSVEAALDPERFQVALIHATEPNLEKLNGLKGRAEAFQGAGGWIMLWGLGRDGIEEYNRFLGTDHMIRPFRLERVTLEDRKFPLAATLGNRDLALYSPKGLQHGKHWISLHTYSAVVDGRDAAPFTIPPGASEEKLWDYQPTRNDHDPYNFCNGMLNSDNWRYIRQIWVPEDGAEPLVFRFRRPDTISRVRIWNNANYWTIEDLDIIFDGDEENAVRVRLPDSYDLTEVELPEPTHVEESITLQIRSWRKRRPDRPDLRLVGIDNVQFIRPFPPDEAVVIDNAGGLVAYRRGEGGTLLNQIKFMDEEPNPKNADKKLNVLGTLLRNMGVGFGGAAVAVPGINVRVHPVDLLDHCTQFLSEQEEKAGWFGDRGRDMRRLPVGEQVMADVLYDLVDYATAPVSDCIVLGARGAPEGLPESVEGIEVGRKADVLFFLHTARVRQPIRPHERARIGARKRPFQRPEILRYVVHYADGRTAEIPVLLGRDIDHWLQEKPKPLSGALIGRTVQVPGVEDRKGVLYSMQVPNPRPGVKIETIDVVLGKNSGRAIPAVLAISLGEVLD